MTVTKLSIIINNVMQVQVDMARDALYDLEEFIKLRDPILRGSTFPDMELQALCKKMLASRSKRIEMAEVS